VRIKCGLDLVEVSRIEKAIDNGGDNFLTRIYTNSELLACKQNFQSLAGYFAAKEAVAKALGTGLMTQGIKFVDIEIVKDELNAPLVVLAGAAKARYDEMGGQDIAISITHEKEYAAAVCNIVFGERKSDYDR